MTTSTTQGCVERTSPETAEMTRTRFIARWQQRLADFARFDSMVRGTLVLNDVFADLELLWATESSEWLPAKVASARCGYSEDHLRRLARTARVVAEKRGRSWWYLAGSLPRKPSGATRLVTFDPAQAARRSLDRLTKTLVDNEA